MDKDGSEVNGSLNEHKIVKKERLTEMSMELVKLLRYLIQWLDQFWNKAEMLCLKFKLGWRFLKSGSECFEKSDKCIILVI